MSDSAVMSDPRRSRSSHRRRIAATGAAALGVLALTATALAGGSSPALARRARVSAGSAHHHRRHKPQPSFGATASPIKHVIVILGENHSFDNVFGTYSAMGA